MTNARPAAFPVALEQFAGETTTDGARSNVEAAVLRDGCSPPPQHGRVVLQPRLTRVQWLNSLNVGDAVLVRNHVHEHFPAQITDASPCYLHTSKLKFHRLTGAQTNRQRRRVYRMRLLLVRDEKEEV